MANLANKEDRKYTLDKSAAAEILGVSVRTLERLAAQGRLTRGRVRGKTRPLVMFDRQEVEALQQELATTRPARVLQTAAASAPQDAVGFRLDPSYVKRLSEEGQKAGMSAGEYARRLVIRGLEEEVSDRVLSEVKALRQALTDMFYLLLITKLDTSEAEANEILALLSKGT